MVAARRHAGLELSLLVTLATAQQLSPSPPCAEGLNADCFASGCCADESHACYKRTSVQHAQCRPREASCVDTDEWLCPGWELCSERFTNCQRSQCCQRANDVCYQKHERFAQCRPRGDCVGRMDGESRLPWLCSVLHVPDTCSADWQECTSTKCCATPGFTCFEKTPFFARCMRECPDPATASHESFSCNVHDRHQITTDSLMEHRNGRAHETCSPNRGECTVAGCCENPGYTCYERGPHYAMCLPGGECRSFWPESTGATCNMREQATECASAGQDCSQSLCCANEGFTCYQKDSVSHEARCMRGCHDNGDSLAGWQCHIIDKNVNPPPQPPAPPPAPFFHSSYGTTCASFKLMTSIHAASCQTLTSPTACMSKFRESALRPTYANGHVLEPCVWVYGANRCAQGGPVECTPAQVTYVPSALPVGDTEGARQAKRDAAEVQGAIHLDGVFDGEQVRDVEHSISAAPNNEELLSETPPPLPHEQPQSQPQTTAQADAPAPHESSSAGLEGASEGDGVGRPAAPGASKAGMSKKTAAARMPEEVLVDAEL